MRTPLCKVCECEMKSDGEDKFFCPWCEKYRERDGELGDLTHQEMKEAFREMSRCDGWYGKLAHLGLYADHGNRQKLYNSFKKEIRQYYNKAENRKRTRLENQGE